MSKRRECQHVNRYAKTFTVEGVTHPIVIRQWWCRDCGALISQEAM